MKSRAIEARERFKENLNRYMHIKGITQADIVDRLHVSSATASDWVNGNKYPRVDAMQALAELLEVSMQDLIQYASADTNNNNDLMALRERLRRQPGMRILFDATKNATEQDLLDAVHLIEGFKKRRDGEI